MSGWDLLEGGRGVLAAVREGATVGFRDGAPLADPRIDAELEQAGVSLALAGPVHLAGELVAARAAGTLFSGEEEQKFDAPALRWAGDPDPGATTRSIAILLEDGDLLAVRASGQPDAPHGNEEIVGAFTRGRKGQIDVTEVLLSTEYGGDGTQRRATIELWPGGDEDLPCRGAGTALCAATVDGPGVRRSVAFFAWSFEGRAGLGRYEIARPA